MHRFSRPRHLRRPAVLAAGALLLGTPLLSGCNINGLNQATERVNAITAGTNDQDMSIDVLGAMIVSKEKGSGTFIATLVNNSPDQVESLDSLAGTDPSQGLKFADFSPISVPPRGLVNLAIDGGVGVTGSFQAGDFVRVHVGLSTGESADLNVQVMPDAGTYAGLDTASSAS